MSSIREKIPELKRMKKYPQTLYYRGNRDLLEKEKISIIGSRKPLKYSRELTYKLASALAKVDVCIVSGGAMGIDAVAHLGAGEENTIAVLPCGIALKYPAINKNLLHDIENKGLLLSQFEEKFQARAWSFVVRNELVVALGKVLVVAEAELGSGSMRSIEYALQMKKDIYVLPHRLGESSATLKLVEEGKAKVIYDIDKFVNMFATKEQICIKKDDFLLFCETNPSYEALVAQFPSRVFEAELSGMIEIRNAKVYLR